VDKSSTPYQVEASWFAKSASQSFEKIINCSFVNLWPHTHVNILLRIVRLIFFQYLPDRHDGMMIMSFFLEQKVIYLILPIMQEIQRKASTALFKGM